MTRFCASCGTEVDDNAVFCPTCGQPIDQETESEMPPAPAWPDPEPEPQTALPASEPAEPAEAADAGSTAMPAPRPVAEDRGWPVGPAADEELPPRDEGRWAEPEAEMTRVVEPQPTADVEGTPSSAASAGWPPASRRPPSREPARPAVDLPLTMPVTLSAWLIGGGATLGAIGALIALFDGLGTAVDVLLLVGLLAVAASVFLSDRLPNVPHLRLVTLAVVLVAFGVALDRLGFGRAGAGELLLFLGTAGAAIGAIILETGRDQPLGGPSA